MIRVFGASDRDFSSNGDVILKPLRAVVTKEDNGDFFLELDAGLEYADYLVGGNIIVVPLPQGEQAFRITEPQKTRTKVTLKAWHIYYDAENYLIKDSNVVNKDCADALAHLNAATDTASPFSTASDIATVDNYRCVRKSLSEAVTDVLGRWGGHLKRDNWSISIDTTIGQDNGVTVRYAKNLKEITFTENWDGVVTKLLPTGKDGIMLNALDPAVDPYVYSSTTYAIPYTKTVEFSQNINAEDYKDAGGNTDETAYKTALIADLRAQAQAYVDAHSVPEINYTLKANVDKITDVGDIIEVIDERLGIDLLTSLISFKYDAILKKYTELEFGNFREKKLSNLIQNITADAVKASAKLTNNAVYQASEATAYRAGNTATVGNVVAAGVLTDTAETIIFSVPLTKSATSVSTTITDLRLNVYTADGQFALSPAFVANGYDVLADQNITVTTSAPTANLITVTLTKATPFNGADNSPVAVRIHGVSFVFS